MKLYIDDHLNIDDIKIKLLSELSKDFSGAEIEQVVIDAMRIGFNDNREFSKDSRNFGAIKIKNILSFYRS